MPPRWQNSNSLGRCVPNDAEVTGAIASIHRRRGEWEAAIAEFSRAATFDPRNPNIPEAIAFSRAPSRRYAEALDALERALTIQPDYWGALTGISDVPYSEQWRFR